MEIKEAQVTKKEKMVTMTESELKECCANCVHCAEVKKRPIYNTIATKICLYYKNTENSNYILEVDDTDICEVFNLNENKEGLIYEDDTTGDN